MTQSKLEQQREEFLALFAHELLTPLTCILGWSQLAHDHSDSAMLQQALNVIERNVRRQKTLLDEVLRLLHYTRGSSLSFNPRQIDLWRLVEHYQERPPRPVKRDRQLTLALDETDRVA